MTIDWQPIETAPQDEVVMVYWHGMVTLGIYRTATYRGKGGVGWRCSETPGVRWIWTRTPPSYWARKPDGPRVGS